MRKKILSIILTAAMALTLLPTAALAAGRNYGTIPIYVGQSDVDYMAEEILKELPTQGKSAKEQIRTVYDWIVKNCESTAGNGTRYFDEKDVVKQADKFYQQANTALETGDIQIRPSFQEESVYDPNYGKYVTSSDSNQYIANYAYEMMLYRTGSSAHDAALLALLLGHLGFDCRVITGSLADSSGSLAEHKWNYVLVAGQYYWLDVRMDRAIYDSTGKLSYQYFMVTDTKEWGKTHRWDDEYSAWLATNSADIAEGYGYNAALISKEPWSRCSGWAENQMKQAYTMGLIPARLQSRDLTADISRTEFAAVAVAMYEQLKGTKAPAYAGKNPFSDTDDADVLKAYSLGVVKGMGGGLYAPDDTLTREQAMTMLGRVWELVKTGVVGDGSSLQHGDVQKFDDDSSISDYAKDYIYFFAAQGVVDGIGNNLLDPRAQMTREAALKMTVEAAKRW